METPFPHYKSMGAFCCHGHQSFYPICLKTLCSPSPPPMMLHINFNQDWPTRHSKASNSKVSSMIRPEINLAELLCLSWLPATLMMIRSKINELAWRQQFPFISLWGIFRRSRAAYTVVSGSGPIWPKFELVWDFMHSLVTCKYKKDRDKNNREKVETSFSPL